MRASNVSAGIGRVLASAHPHSQTRDVEARAMVQTAARTLEERSFPIPEIGADDAVLRVEACGICGSDCEQFEGVLPVRLPVVPGHEPLGFIERIGKSAAARWGVREGDRVVVEPILSCGNCRYCASGMRHLCSVAHGGSGTGFRCYSYISTDVPPSLWGAYADYMYLAPETTVHKIDTKLPAEIAVLYNPLGAGFRWTGEIGGVKRGDRVVILGPGQRGLTSVIVAARAGASQIIVTGLSKDRAKLELARKLGATRTVDVEQEDPVDVIFEATGGEGADLVVEVTAYAVDPVAQSLVLARRGGTIVLAGVKGMKEVPGFVSDRAVLKELTIRGAIGVTSSAFRAAIDLIESGDVDLAAMHTHSFALSDAERAIQTLAGKIEGEHAICCCLLPGS
jgi:threonine dehydrogenase-like Zn-dependent dehydrogenase